MVKLSVVIPHLNYGRYLRECLDSVAFQTFGDYEAILVDGGSTDETFEVLKDYPWVTVVDEVPPRSPVNAVNQGMRIMRGEFFNQLNSDCYLLPEMYSVCVEALEADASLGMVYTGWRRINDKGQFLGYASQPETFRRELLLRGNFIDASSMVVRSKCLRAVGGFDVRCPWSMDWLVAVKIASKFPVRFINQPLFDYRVHAGQVTEEKSKREHGKALSIVRGYYGVGARVKAGVVSKAKRTVRRVLK